MIFKSSTHGNCNWKSRAKYIGYHSNRFRCLKVIRTSISLIHAANTLLDFLGLCTIFPIPKL